MLHSHSWYCNTQVSCALNWARWTLWSCHDSVSLIDYEAVSIHLHHKWQHNFTKWHLTCTSTVKVDCSGWEHVCIHSHIPWWSTWPWIHKFKPCNTWHATWYDAVWVKVDASAWWYTELHIREIVEMYFIVFWKLPTESCALVDSCEISRPGVHEMNCTPATHMYVYIYIYTYVFFSLYTLTSITMISLYTYMSKMFMPSSLSLSLSLSLSIYITMNIDVHLSLSLSLYIYIHDDTLYIW